MLHDIRLDPLSEADFGTVADLADRIWRSHYIAMISMAQIDYMLDGRYAPERVDVDMQAVLREIDDARDEDAARRLRMATAA